MCKLLSTETNWSWPAIAATAWSKNLNLITVWRLLTTILNDISSYLASLNRPALPPSFKKACCWFASIRRRSHRDSRHRSGSDSPCAPLEEYGAVSACLHASVRGPAGLYFRHRSGLGQRGEDPCGRA